MAPTSCKDTRESIGFGDPTFPTPMARRQQDGGRQRHRWWEEEKVCNKDDTSPSLYTHDTTKAIK